MFDCSTSPETIVQKYRVYQEPVPHPALREGKITKLLSFVNRAMVIAQLTPGEVPSDCFPKTTADQDEIKMRRRLTAR